MNIHNQFKKCIYKIKSIGRLIRTQSSSPTVRSSSINDDLSSSEPNKNRKLTRFRPVLTLFCSGFFTIVMFFYYRRKVETARSENLLVALILIAIVLFLALKNKNLVTEKVSSLNLYDTNHPVSWSESSNVQLYKNGDFYQGQLLKNRAHGSGVYNFCINGRYEGEWVEGKYEGYGIERWARGGKYKGQYRHGLRHGFGVYSFYSGDSYGGEWWNGESHGVGVQSCSDGSCYVGEFKCGVKHGLGCYHFRNGDRYAGEYFGDKVHGFGAYQFANGHCYQGSWHQGRKQGYGMYTFRGGESKCGEWDCNILKIQLPNLTDAVLSAVQAARRRAENAMNLGSVDEQVKKAVTVANKAATVARVAAVKAVQNQTDARFCDEV